MTWEWCTRDGPECSSSGHQSVNHQTKHNLIPSPEYYLLGTFRNCIKYCHQHAGAELLLQHSELLSHVLRVFLPRVESHPACTASSQCSSVCAPLFGYIHTHY